MSNPNSISWVVIANSPNADPHTAAVAGSSAVQHGIPSARCNRRIAYQSSTFNTSRSTSGGSRLKCRYRVRHDGHVASTATLQVFPDRQSTYNWPLNCGNAVLILTSMVHQQNGPPQGGPSSCPSD